MSKYTLTPKQKVIAEKYGHLILETGGNDPIELAERDGVDFFSNSVVAAMQFAVRSQISLLNKLDREGLLNKPMALDAVKINEKSKPDDRVKCTRCKYVGKFLEWHEAPSEYEPDMPAYGCPQCGCDIHKEAPKDNA